MKTGVSQVETKEGELTKNVKEAANVLNNLKSEFTEEPEGGATETSKTQAWYWRIRTDDFTLEDVITKIHQLKPDKSPCIDQVHRWVLKECSEEMAIPLFKIFKKS